MTSIADVPDEPIIVGVDTHQSVHVAVALNEIGGRLAEQSIPVARAGYEHLESWALSLGAEVTFGVEGTGSYGAGLASYLRRRGYRVTPHAGVSAVWGEPQPIQL